MQGGLAAAERVAGLLDLPASDDEPSAATLPWHTSLLQAKSPAISFDHVSFAYTPGQPVLRDFSLTIPRGSIVALVGASGGGKSTAVALLQRLYEPESGRICVFGHDLRELDTLELRQQMAVVPQEISLFMGSLKENIVYGRLEANDEAIIRAAGQAGILDMKLTDGLNTMIGPRGTKLSGGQRQRVAIARALVREAPILIFDEATSALDTLSEERIRTTLETLREQHTILLVAHRLSTVRSANLIVVMEQGCAVESGTHDDLIRRGGVYAALIQGQYNADIAKQTTSILPRL
jgi:ABC-type multidrug transport system fused ATPase/permease subunit